MNGNLTAKVSLCTESKDIYRFTWDFHILEASGNRLCSDNWCFLIWLSFCLENYCCSYNQCTLSLDTDLPKLIRLHSPDCPFPTNTDENVSITLKLINLLFTFTSLIYANSFTCLSFSILMKAIQLLWLDVLMEQFVICCWLSFNFISLFYMDR